MRKSLIIFLILTLLMEGIGGFLDSRCASSHAAKFSGASLVSLLSDLDNNHKGPQGDQTNESHEIVEMPSEDDYCHCPTFDLKTTLPEIQEQESYSDFYIRHYPWAPKEIHTPPPKA